MFLHFLQDVSQTQKVLFYLFQLAHGGLFPGLVFTYPCGLFKDHPPLLGIGLEEHVYFPLFYQGVAVRTQTGVHKQFFYVFQAAELFVNEVFGFSCGVEPSGDADLLVFQGEEALVVDEGNGGLRITCGGAVVVTAKDYVSHLGGPEGLSALFPQYPLYGIYYVTLAAPVRSDDDGDAWGEREFCLICEGFETEEFQFG